jgi:transposase InsO family protein
MNTTQLADHLFTLVFSWVSLPEESVGDRDTRLTASQMRKLLRQLTVRLKLSVAYHPQTDGTTERFNRTFLQMLRTTLSLCMHSDWEKNIPALHFCMRITTLCILPQDTLLINWTPHTRDCNSWRPSNSIPSGEVSPDRSLHVSSGMSYLTTDSHGTVVEHGHFFSN